MSVPDHDRAFAPSSVGPVQLSAVLSNFTILRRIIARRCCREQIRKTAEENGRDIQKTRAWLIWAQISALWEFSMIPPMLGYFLHRGRTYLPNRLLKVDLLYAPLKVIVCPPIILMFQHLIQSRL